MTNLQTTEEAPLDPIADYQEKVAAYQERQEALQRAAEEAHFSGVEARYLAAVKAVDSINQGNLAQTLLPGARDIERGQTAEAEAEAALKELQSLAPALGKRVPRAAPALKDRKTLVSEALRNTQMRDPILQASERAAIEEYESTGYGVRLYGRAEMACRGRAFESKKSFVNVLPAHDTIKIMGAAPGFWAKDHEKQVRKILKEIGAEDLAGHHLRFTDNGFTIMAPTRANFLHLQNAYTQKAATEAQHGREIPVLLEGKEVLPSEAAKRGTFPKKLTYVLDSVPGVLTLERARMIAAALVEGVKPRLLDRVQDFITGT